MIEMKKLITIIFGISVLVSLSYYNSDDNNDTYFDLEDDDYEIPIVI
jgi:hypothetical protein